MVSEIIETVQNILSFRTKNMKNCLVLLLPIALVFLTFAVSYYIFSHNNLPIGWDTPRYVWQHAMATSRISDFSRFNDGYNILYSIVGSFFVRFGLSPLAVEILLPPILVISLIYVIIHNLRQMNRNSDTSIPVFLTLSWFAVYRIGADLHANLLGLLFILSAFYFLSKS